MTHAAKIARDDFITEALRAANDALGNEQPTAQALAIIAAIKGLRRDPVRVASLSRVDYLTLVQQAAQAAWTATRGRLPHQPATGPGNDATAGIDTPIGRLTALTYRRVWNGRNGQRIAWATEYSLDGEPITLAEIREAGLAQRPTTRNRQKKET
jgi:hypothetical protein